MRDPAARRRPRALSEFSGLLERKRRAPPDSAENQFGVKKSMIMSSMAPARYLVCPGPAGHQLDRDTPAACA